MALVRAGESPNAIAVHGVREGVWSVQQMHLYPWRVWSLQGKPLWEPPNDYKETHSLSSLWGALSSVENTWLNLSAFGIGDWSGTPCTPPALFCGKSQCLHVTEQPRGAVGAQKKREKIFGGGHRHSKQWLFSKQWWNKLQTSSHFPRMYILVIC